VTLTIAPRCAQSRRWAGRGPPDGDRLDVLATLVEAYEEKRWPLTDMDPVEAIEAAMAHDATPRADLGALIGSNRATEVLKRKRALTLPMIRRIAREWHVPERLLVRVCCGVMSLWRLSHVTLDKMNQIG
jgi:HTH-type transcriptional regulator/antitoxin HigA